MKRGFTIIEILIVIAVMGILGTLGYKKFTDVMLESKASSTIDQLEKIKLALGKYQADTGTYPASLGCLIEKPTSGANVKCLVAAATATAIEAQKYDIIYKNTDTSRFNKYWKGPYLTQDMVPIDVEGGNYILNGITDYPPIGSTGAGTACIRLSIGLICDMQKFNSQYVGFVIYTNSQKEGDVFFQKATGIDADMVSGVAGSSTSTSTSTTTSGTTTSGPTSDLPSFENVGLSASGSASSTTSGSTGTVKSAVYNKYPLFRGSETTFLWKTQPQPYTAQ